MTFGQLPWHWPVSSHKGVEGLFQIWPWKAYRCKSWNTSYKRSICIYKYCVISFKGNLDCWHELMLTVLQIMSWLQILLPKGNVTFNNNNKQNRLWLLNFLPAAISDFIMSQRCTFVSNRRTSAFQQQRQRSDFMKSKMAARRKFKSGNLFCLSLLLNVTFPLLVKFVI